jgi:hypothetical protein
VARNNFDKTDLWAISGVGFRGVPAWFFALLNYDHHMVKPCGLALMAGMVAVLRDVTARFEELRELRKRVAAAS